MKNPAGLLVTIMIIVVPMVWCIFSLMNTEAEYDENVNKMQDMTEDINGVVDSNFVNNDSNKSGDNVNSSGNTYEGNNDAESQGNSIGTPIGKIVEGATVNVEVANVYANPDETSNIIGTVTKNTTVTVHDYPNGWSWVKVDQLSGWTKTIYIDKPDDIGNVSIGSVVGKTAKISAKSLNVRESAVSGAIKTTLTEGTEVKILGVNSENTWYEIQWRTTSGWVSAEYVEVQY